MLRRTARTAAARRSRAPAGSTPPRPSPSPRPCAPSACAAGCSLGRAARGRRPARDHLARTAAAYGADVRTRARVTAATGTGVTLRDELDRRDVRRAARAVVNATGVWAGGLDEQVRLRPEPRHPPRPARRRAAGLRTAVTMPVPGHDQPVRVGAAAARRHHLRRPHRRARDGPVPDVPEPSEAEIDFLLGVVAAAFDHAATPRDVVGAFAGLRPLLEVRRRRRPPTCPAGTPSSPRATGVMTVVGGKLTTYRRMAQDTLDASSPPAARRRAVPHRVAPPVGAASRTSCAARGPARLVRRFGTDAALVLATARRSPAWPTTSCSPRSPRTSR